MYIKSYIFNLYYILLFFFCSHSPSHFSLRASNFFWVTSRDTASPAAVFRLFLTFSLVHKQKWYATTYLRTVLSLFAWLSLRLPKSRRFFYVCKVSAYPKMDKPFAGKMWLTCFARHGIPLGFRSAFWFHMCTKPNTAILYSKSFFIIMFWYLL